MKHPKEVYAFQNEDYERDTYSYWIHKSCCLKKGDSVKVGERYLVSTAFVMNSPHKGSFYVVI